MIPQDTSQLMAYAATTTNINIIPVIVYTPLIKFELIRQLLFQ